MATANMSFACNHNALEIIVIIFREGYVMAKCQCMDCPKIVRRIYDNEEIMRT